MAHRTADYQAKMYLYDLHNMARENGFKADDTWEISLVTEEEKTAIVNKHIHTIAVKIAPAILLETFTQVKDTLNLPKTETEEAYTNDSIRVNHIKYLMAFSAKKLRR
ncbi:MAG: hypothetical protein ABIN91_14105 [Mucilaginibacter sp.]|uniref:hypothetical protein n=1 Tax=Mucilaginibacter sp. TaxID=1882438 RepID=UPI003267591A